MDHQQIDKDRSRTVRWGFALGLGAAIVLTSCPALAATTAVAKTATATTTTAATTVTPPSPPPSKWGDPMADKAAKDANGKNTADADPGSLYTVEQAIGARTLWNAKDSQRRNITGQGVGVAILDSGVSAVPGLDGTGKVTYGPDLSIEDNGVLNNQDTFGHGTFMAGLVAGRGTTDPSASLAAEPARVQLGVAPDAKLLAVKLATADGSTDVSQVIAALDWVSQHPVMADGTRIRVINLSYGTDSVQPYQVDPLAAAAENAWRHGIVVVASVGNSGTATGHVTDPASDPYVLAVGAADSGDQVNGWSRGKVQPASFSNVASTGRHADLIAPGTSVVSLRDPGSYIDVNHPEGLVSGDTTGTLFRGSGTSQAAAVTSGAIALLLQAYPSLTPDEVKAALTATADPVTGASATAVGAGEINLTAAMAAAAQLTGSDTKAASYRSLATQKFTASTGLGSIDQARGGSVLVDADGNDVSGEVDVQGDPWNATAWAQASSSLTAWSGGNWMGSTWTGSSWDNSSGLSSARWSSARWSSARWSDAGWTSARWSSARWSSARWSSARWSSARWSSRSW